MTAPVESLLRRFRDFGERPSVERYLALFHPEATLLDAGMARPITVAEIPEHMEGILKVVPDFRLEVERWREREGTLFIEARNQATLGRDPIQWRAVYCVDLAGDRVIRGRRYYDRRPLFARLDPALPRLPAYAPVAGAEPRPAEAPPGPEALVRAFGAAWSGGTPEDLAGLFREDATLAGPDLPRPLARGELAHYHGALRALCAGLRLELEAWAGDASLAFAEWRLTARLGGEPVTLRMADRFDLAGGTILAARAYFDTLELAARLAREAR
jgi:ketosteroid isomerase-like protein